jgi:3-hydroxybutyryl-CoA dehydrogenase
MRVVIAGAGLMGAQIGCEYALGGHDVTLVARDVAAVGRRVDGALALVSEHRLASESAMGAARSRLRVAGGLEEAGDGFDLAVESLPEDVELKTQALRELARTSPGSILASNTSSIPISALQAGVGHGAADRVVGTHYLNPPLLMPTVEVIAGERTAPAVTERVVGALAALGKLPVVVRRDVPGFVWNRLQFALLRECAWLVDNGVAAPADVDLVVREGLARRWRRVGPFAAIGLGGLDTWSRSAANLVPELATGDELGDLARFVPGGDELARLAAGRDAALAEELRRERNGAG